MTSQPLATSVRIAIAATMAAALSGGSPSGSSTPGNFGSNGFHQSAARREANLTVEETAQAAGVDGAAIQQAESELPVPAADAEAIEALVAQLR